MHEQAPPPAAQKYALAQTYPGKNGIRKKPLGFLRMPFFSSGRSVGRPAAILPRAHKAGGRTVSARALLRARHPGQAGVDGQRVADVLIVAGAVVARRAGRDEDVLFAAAQGQAG